MASTPALRRRIPVRGGVPKTLTMTREAPMLLEERTPTNRSFGMYLSALIMAEGACCEARTQRRRVRKDAMAGAVAGGDDTGERREV